MKNELFSSLEKNLLQLVRVYRLLFETVRREKNVLIRADLEQLPEINETKEILLKKINQLESGWTQLAMDMQKEMNLKTDPPRLLEIANGFSGEQKEKLLRLRTVLNLLINRTSQMNKQNEPLAQSAISHIAGAMQAFTETLNKKSNYEKKGKRSESSLETSGRLVSKEV